MRHFFAHLKLLLSIHVVGILFFTLFRVVLLISEYSQLSAIPDGGTLVFRSFLIGLWFDNVIASYISLLPCVVLLVCGLIGFYRKRIVQAVVWYAVILYTLSFLIFAADIPYFAEFNKHINFSIFNWAGEKSFVGEMIFKEPKYLLALLLFLLSAVAYAFILVRLRRKLYRGLNSYVMERAVPQIIIQVIVALGVLFLCIAGGRGRLAVKSPIRVGSAYFSEYHFTNQLGLNPVFYFINNAVSLSKAEKEVDLMDNTEAVRLAQQLLGIENPSSEYPIAREVVDTLVPSYKNVVVILMEGMSAEALSRHGNENSRCRFLDSLSNHCYYFENCYSAGIHTMNGIFGTMFSFPAYLTQHPTKVNDVPIYQGFPYTLRQKGYQTAYITTHDDQFDNIGGFLRVNYVQQVMAQKDYPSGKVLSNLGVPDDYMFERGVELFNELAASGKPFFATMLTASNHSPIRIPDYYTPTPGDLKEQVLEYSDWALSRFFAMAKQQSWYDSTIFILLGDHGGVFGPQLYDISLSYNHIPLMIVSPAFEEPKVFSQPTGQIDVFPTVMGLLNQSYTNNTFGVDAIKNPRQYIYFSADNVIGCVDTTWLYVYHTEGREGLYDYAAASVSNVIGEYPEKADSMKKYALSMTQASHYIIANGKTLAK